MKFGKDMQADTTSSPLGMKPVYDQGFLQPIRAARKYFGKRKLRHVQEILQFCIVENLFSRADYYLYGMHKAPVVSAKAAREYVGNTRNVMFIRRVNRMDSTGRTVLKSKSLTDIVLRSASIPTEPILASYCPSLPGLCGETLRSAEDIAGFLQNTSAYPLFGKPTSGVFSSGVVSISARLADTNAVRLLSGETASVPELASYIARTFPRGYIFQRRIDQHEGVSRFSGGTVSSIRVFTINEEGSPSIYYAIWKLASPDSVADNSWRPGVAFCMIDLETGRVSKAAVAKGGVREDATHHPATGVPLVGLQVPCWNEVREVALRASSLFADLPLVGWDVAVTRNGPVIIEGAEDPGPALYQMVENKGFLSKDFMRILKNLEAKQTPPEPHLRQPSRRERLQRWMKKVDVGSLFGS